VQKHERLATAAAERMKLAEPQLIEHGASLPGFAVPVVRPLLCLQVMMAKRLNVGAWACPILTGIGLVSGCTDNADGGKNRLDDAALACTPERTVYQLVSIDPSLREAHTIDLDGDGAPDDALGRAHDMIAGVDPAFAVAPRFATRLRTDVPWLLAIDRCGTEVRVTIDEGMVLPGDPLPQMPGELPRAVGTLRDSVLEARDGQVHIPLGALADVSGTAPPRWITGDGLTIRATILADEIDGVFGAAFEPTDTRGELAPPIAAFLTGQPNDDWLKVGADSNQDGTVTAGEVTATTPFSDATAGDVMIIAPDGTPRFDAPTVSLALRFHAVRIR
jgi:hypothetical protein